MVDYFLITSLPTLPELGATPPIAPGELLARVQHDDPAAQAVAAVLMGGDLLQHEAYLSGEIKEVHPAVLSPRMLRNEEPLPDELAAEPGAAPQLAADSLWMAYFRHARGVADATHSRFLMDWLDHELGLRSALAGARAAALGLEASQYQVAQGQPLETAAFQRTVQEWAAAPDPLQGLRVLDQARWNWIAQQEPYYSFDRDELVAYAAKLMLLHRWTRLSEEAT